MALRREMGKHPFQTNRPPGKVTDEKGETSRPKIEKRTSPKSLLTLGKARQIAEARTGRGNQNHDSQTTNHQRSPANRADAGSREAREF